MEEGGIAESERDAAPPRRRQKKRKGGTNRMKNTTKSIVLVFVTLFILGGSIAHGQVTPPPVGSTVPPDSKWDFTVVPYLWAVGIDGKVEVGGYSADFNVSFSDIWKGLKSAALVHMEARKDKWGLFFNSLYMNPAFDGTFRRARTILPGVTPPVRDVTLDFQQWGVEAGALYQIGSWPLEEKGQSITLDVLAGARYWWLSADLDTSTFVNPSKSTEWVDPFIGLRVTTDITKKCIFTLRGDVGGFGVGSDFSWNGSGLFGYRFTRNIQALAGYKAVYINYKAGSSSLRWNATYHGPLMGLAITW